MYINEHGLTSGLARLDLKNNKYLHLKAKLFGTTTSGMILKKPKVKTKKLFTIIKSHNIKKIDLVKIDTEGHEFEVLKGMGRNIKNIKSILLLKDIKHIRNLINLRINKIGNLGRTGNFNFTCIIFNC